MNDDTCQLDQSGAQRDQAPEKASMHGYAEAALAVDDMASDCAQLWVGRVPVRQDPVHADTFRFPWPLRIRCLGRFGVLLDDLPLTFHTKAQKKPLELLKALIAAGGRSVSVTGLSTQVWPELEGDAAQNALNIALMRLRRLLRNDHAVVLQEGKLTLDSRHAWVDNWAFERLVSRVDTLAPRRVAAVAEVPEGLAARALELYQGHFLAQEEQPWALACRERLRSKFLRLFSVLGKRLESDGKLDAAIDLYRRAIEIEPLAEAFHQCLMRVLKAQGRIAEALDAYRHCRDLLSITLSVDPTGETQALYRSLIGGQARRSGFLQSESDLKVQRHQYFG